MASGPGRGLVAVVAHLGVGGVEAQDGLVLLAPCVDLLQVVQVAGGAGGVVGVVEVEYPGALGALVHVEQPVLLGPKGDLDALGLVEDRGRAGVHGVPGRGGDDGLPGVHEGLGDVEDALLGADGDAHLGVRVHVDVEPLLVPGRHGPPEVLLALGRGVLLVVVDARLLAELLDDAVGGGEVGISDPEVDHVPSSGPLLGGELLQPDEEVRGDLFQSVCLFESCHIKSPLSRPRRPAPPVPP